jgi:cbb3-type cytochrome oxidase subunit 1
VQRTCHARLFSDKLASFTFWGWQLVIVLAADHAAAGADPARNTPSSNGRSTS